MKTMLAIFCVSMLVTLPVFGEDVDSLRTKEVEQWSKSGFGDVNVIMKNATAILADENATISQLKDAAKSSNAAANFIGNITDVYDDYKRENYKYDFVLEKVNPSRDAYVAKSNALKVLRNQCYFRIGLELKGDGKNLEAFLYFKDAFRLSPMVENGKEGLRYKAEQEMKKLLGLQEIESFVTWQSTQARGLKTNNFGGRLGIEIFSDYQ